MTSITQPGATVPGFLFSNNANCIVEGKGEIPNVVCGLRKLMSLMSSKGKVTEVHGCTHAEQVCYLLMQQYYMEKEQAKLEALPF